MSRIPGVEPNTADPYAQRVLEGQAKHWGGPLLNHLVYARRPTIFRAVRGMWAGIEGSGLIEGALQALLNRRVARLNGCEFWADINAAVGSALGLSDEKLLALDAYGESELFDERERVALTYADAITLSDRDVDDELFARVRSVFSEDEIVELTEIIAWENASSKFNRALRIPSQGLWKRQAAGAD
jgi:alkylhydroperoxidase family enzyme